MSKEVHELLMPNSVLYGEDSFQKIGEQARKYGEKVLIISDPIMNKLGYVEECQTYLQEWGIHHASYLGVDKEPTNIHVEEAMAVCHKENCDLVVAIGGGSCIDTAKAVAVLMTNEGTITNYFETGKPFEKSPLPVIAVPTTAGTGSEVTKVTVITDTETNTKMMLSKPELLPTVAIVDPKLTVSCPPNVTAATGVDALCHAIEAYISRKAHPMTDTFALKAIHCIMENIRIAYQDGSNLEARDQMAFGSMLAGAAFSNASVTLVHGMSRPIGALFHTPHGISNAMLLPAVLEFTKDAAIERLADIGRQMIKDGESHSDETLANHVINEVKKLCLDLNIPNMKVYGIDENEFKRSVSKMAADAIASGSPANNPRIPTSDEIIDLYDKCFYYDFSMPILQ